jgi:hypothetical protein
MSTNYRKPFDKRTNLLQTNTATPKSEPSQIFVGKDKVTHLDLNHI